MPYLRGWEWIDSWWSGLKEFGALSHHCRNGHERTAENAYRDGGGNLRCRICVTEWEYKQHKTHYGPRKKKEVVSNELDRVPQDRDPV